jgi:uncharacterized protein (DUF1778 family)
MKEDFGLKRGADIPEAVELRAGFDQDVGRDVQPAEGAVRALGATARRLVAMRHDHHQVQVAALVGFAPGVRAEQPDLFRLKLLHEAAGDFAKQIWAEGFHAASLPIPPGMARREMRLPGIAKVGHGGGFWLPPPLHSTLQGLIEMCVDIDHTSMLVSAMPSATANLHLRIEPQKKRLLQQAAKIAHASTLTEYVIGSALRQAEQDLLERRTFTMNGGDWDRFEAILERPARVVPALKALAAAGDVFRRP